MIVARGLSLYVCKALSRESLLVVAFEYSDDTLVERLQDAGGIRRQIDQHPHCSVLKVERSWNWLASGCAWQKSVGGCVVYQQQNLTA